MELIVLKNNVKNVANHLNAVNIPVPYKTAQKVMGLIAQYIITQIVAQFVLQKIVLGLIVPKLFVIAHVAIVQIVKASNVKYKTAQVLIKQTVQNTLVIIQCVSKTVQPNAKT